MNTVGVIPARWRSSRFEGKALASLGGRPMIQHVYERARQASLLDRVLVATDDERIAAAVRSFGGEVAMTSPAHPSGTDRVAETVRDVVTDVVVNIQGDEPFISPRVIDQAVEPLVNAPELEMATLMRVIRAPAALEDPNVVKVVVDQEGYALYFSRSRIPHPRRGEQPPAHEHIGLYAYRKDFLLEFAAWPPSELEQAERLEQLRVLEHGRRIKVVLTEEQAGVSVDTRADLQHAQRLLRELQRDPPSV